jgi:hypothetical protein
VRRSQITVVSRWCGMPAPGTRVADRQVNIAAHRTDVGNRAERAEGFDAGQDERFLCGFDHATLPLHSRLAAKLFIAL